MKLSSTLLLVAALFGAGQVRALEVRSFSLSSLGEYKYDAALPGQPPTPAQKAIDYMATLGANHVVLTPEARMDTYTSNDITPVTRPGEVRKEREAYARLINYVHGKGMTVGIRPIILVKENLGGAKWHGNIQPQDPAAWFKSFNIYLATYSGYAAENRAEEFTVAAELYSMTVGLEDQWKANPYGFPYEMTDSIRLVREQFASLAPGFKVRIMYDANYTDLSANSDGTGASGGEFERWRARLVDFKPNPANKATMSPANVAGYKAMLDLWNAIDSFGIDMYRSLATRGQPYPEDYPSLVKQLTKRTDSYSQDIDNKLYAIEKATGKPKKVIIKEIGFKSCTGCFIDPFVYDDPRLQPNIPHQAAAYEAFMTSFPKGGFDWLQGVSFWHISANPADQGMNNPGFTPRGKPQTEEVIRKGWN